MDMSGLLSMLKWIGTIFPIFTVEFPFHIAYDIIIRLASSWILEDSVGEIAEFFNSALEDAVDLACPEIHPVAKRAKDFASGAVCLITCSNFVIWGVALWTIFF